LSCPSDVTNGDPLARTTLEASASHPFHSRWQHRSPIDPRRRAPFGFRRPPKLKSVI